MYRKEEIEKDCLNWAQRKNNKLNWWKKEKSETFHVYGEVLCHKEKDRKQGWVRGRAT